MPITPVAIKGANPPEKIVPAPIVKRRRAFPAKKRALSFLSNAPDWYALYKKYPSIASIPRVVTTQATATTIGNAPPVATVPATKAKTPTAQKKMIAP